MPGEYGPATPSVPGVSWATFEAASALRPVPTEWLDVMTPAVRLPRPSGPQVTDRDRSILEWVALHGIVTPEQIARHFFLRDGGEVGKWAAYRRLGKLQDLGLIRKDHVYWRHPMVVRLTSAGARLADAGVGPAKLVMAEVPHALAVVDLLEQLRTGAPRGTMITTERELRIQRRRELAANPRLRGRGRIPDAELKWSGKRIALELDLTSKRSFDYERILRAYLQMTYDKVWWYVKPAVAERVGRIVRQTGADDLVVIRAWEG